MKVFLIEKTKKNYNLSSAEMYGALMYIFKEEDRRSSVFDTNQFSVEVITALEQQKFNPQTDALCIVGSLVTVITVISAMLSQFRDINVLLFSASEQKYVLRRLGDGTLKRDSTRNSGSPRILLQDCLGDYNKDEGT